jgi:hypothetical protein
MSLKRFVWKPVAFYSQKLIPIKKNYITRDQEILVIIASFKEWRHYLEMPAFIMRVVSDHFNLQSFMIMKNLNRRQVCWALDLASFDFVIFHHKDKDNLADGPSRRPDYVMMNLEEENPL